jgi:catechol 2,3-dioxygenase
VSPNTTSPLQLIAVELRVASLAHSLAFYVEKLGLVAAAVKTDSAELSVGTDAPVMLRLTEDRAAPPAPSEAAGLFHAALLLESRTALAGWVRRAAERGVEFDGFADHGVSEAIYLSDPDGNGLEFYADRPTEAWPAGAQAGEVAMFTRPLNLPGLLAEQGPAVLSPLAGARWGHLHLRVTDLERSENFYRGALGMIVTQRSFPGRDFLRPMATITTWASTAGVRLGGRSPRARSGSSRPRFATARGPTTNRCKIRTASTCASPAPSRSVAPPPGPA